MRTSYMQYQPGDPMLTIRDIQEIFDLSRPSAYRLVNSSGFPAFRMNSRIYVHPGKLNDWILRQTGRRYRY